MEYTQYMEYLMKYFWNISKLLRWSQGELKREIFFLCEIIHNVIDSPQILKQIDIHIPRLLNSNGHLFYLKKF